VAAALFLIGALFELAGIVALGFPDLLPGAIRLSEWLRRQENRLRPRVGLPPRPVVHTTSVSDGIVFGGSVSGVVSTSETTLEGKVEYLLRRDQDAQREVNALAARVNDLTAALTARLAEARQEMEEHVARELTAAQEAYRPLRTAGTIALATGLAFVTAAALLA
jgi:hypothetical protein